MEGPVAAQSQYLLGLKQRALMVSPPSRVYRCFPSFRSHSMACPSCTTRTRQGHKQSVQMHYIQKRISQNQDHLIEGEQICLLSNTCWKFNHMTHRLGTDDLHSFNTDQVLYVVTWWHYLSTRSTKGPIRGDGDRVQEASVTNVVSLQLAVGQIPHLRTKEKKIRHQEYTAI